MVTGELVIGYLDDMFTGIVKVNLWILWSLKKHAVKKYRLNRRFQV